MSLLRAAWDQVRFDPSRRFQECGWLERMWRRRLYLGVPLRALKLYQAWSGPDRSRALCWGLSVGIAQADMNYVYTTEEVFTRIRERLHQQAHQAQYRR